MMSGAILLEQIVVLFSRPLALQLLPGFTTSPGGTVNPVFGERDASGYRPGVPIAGAPATPLPFDAKAVCGDATDTPNQAILPQSCTNRISGCRAQLKPATYCASMVSGMFSVPVQHADPVLGEQAPHLTGAEVAVPVVVIVGEVGLANTRIIAVALTRVAVDAAPRKSIS